MIFDNLRREISKVSRDKIKLSGYEVHTSRMSKRFARGIPVIIVAGLMISGCAGTLDHKPFVTKMPDQQLTVITGYSEASDTIISDAASTAVICKTPSAHAIRTAAEAGSISLVTVGDDSTDSESEQEGGIEMKGRTASLLMTQEIMYRFCELSRNAKLTKPEQIDLFKTILGVVEGPWDNLSVNERATEAQVFSVADQAITTPDPTDADSTDANSTDANSTDANSTDG